MLPPTIKHVNQLLKVKGMNPRRSLSFVLLAKVGKTKLLERLCMHSKRGLNTMQILALISLF